jgi:hypothetical protein
LASRALHLALAASFLGVAASLCEAQRRNCSPQGSSGGPNVPYDGRFTMVRIAFVDWTGGDNWCNDYPDMERNFVLILKEITNIRPRLNSSNVMRFDDPELFKFPMIYVTEPGYWTPDAAEIQGLKNYMAKGGLVFFDDFFNQRRDEWNNFEVHFRRAVPDAVFFRLNNTEPIFDSFYKIENLDIPYPNGVPLTAEFYAVYKDNDPDKAMMAIISFNSDLGDYMEWSGTSRNPINLANDAYKFAVNFVVYAMTR